MYLGVAFFTPFSLLFGIKTQTKQGRKNYILTRKWRERYKKYTTLQINGLDYFRPVIFYLTFGLFQTVSPILIWGNRWLEKGPIIKENKQVGKSTSSGLAEGRIYYQSNSNHISGSYKGASIAATKQLLRRCFRPCFGSPFGSIVVYFDQRLWCYTPQMQVEIVIFSIFGVFYIEKAVFRK